MKNNSLVNSQDYFILSPVLHLLPPPKHTHTHTDNHHNHLASDLTSCSLIIPKPIITLFRSRVPNKHFTISLCLKCFKISFKFASSLAVQEKKRKKKKKVTVPPKKVVNNTQI